MTEILDVDEIERRIAARHTNPPQGGEGDATTVHGGHDGTHQHSSPQLVENPTPVYRHIRPFKQAAENLVQFLQNKDGRWMFGVKELDAMIRGVGRGELMYVTGRAHSGKTQLVLQSIANNPDARVLLFTPDEVAELVLSKLVSMTHDIDGEELEQRIKQGDPEIVTLVNSIAEDTYANLLVIDDSLTFDQMTTALNEAEDFWGGPADVVIIDFLELLPGDGEHGGVTAKSQELKRWTKNAGVPMVCLHQSSRSGGPRGQAAGMSGMRYGGETEAIFVVEVFRKREDVSLDDDDKARHQNTISFNVAKNKRPPSLTGEYDLHIHPRTGRVRSLNPGEGMSVVEARAAELDEIHHQQQQRDKLSGTQLGAF